MSELQQKVPLQDLVLATEVAIMGPAAVAYEAVKSHVIETVAGPYINMAVDELSTVLNAGAHHTDTDTIRWLLDRDRIESDYVARFDEYDANPNANTLTALNRAQAEQPRLIEIHGEVQKAQMGGGLLALALATGAAKLARSLSVSSQLRNLTGTAKEAKWFSKSQDMEKGPGLRDHFEKHGSDVGATTAREFDLSARLTIQNGRKFSYLNDKGKPSIGYYDEKTKLFTATSEIRGKYPTIHSHYRLKGSWQNIREWDGFAVD